MRRLVVDQSQKGAAGLAARQQGQAADAGGAAEGPRPPGPTIGARFRQQQRRPQGSGAVLHAEDRRAALRAAFAALGQDRDFLADAERSGLEAAPLAGEAVDKIIALIAATPTELAERLTKAIAPPSQSR